MSSRYRNSATQRGATLVVALLVVVATVALATRMGSDWLLRLRSLQGRLEQQQSRAWLQGAEALAREALVGDLLSGSRVDAPVEPWGQPLLLPLPDGILEACLVDLQGRLSLNALGTPQEEGYSQPQRRFIRLLQTLPLEEPLTLERALPLAHAAFDWADADSRTRNPGGAETQDYLRAGLPYRASNTGFASVAELLLVQGYDRALVTALTPHLTVWGNGAVNLNSLDAGLATRDTTGDETLVLLRTLNSTDNLTPLSDQGARMLRDRRTQRGGVFQDLAVFDQGPFVLQRRELDDVVLDTSWFELHARVEAARRVHFLRSVMQRVVASDGRPDIRVVAREFSSLEDGAWPCAGSLP